MEELLGLEGNAARIYFGAFQRLIKVEDEEQLPRIYRMDFAGRNRRPPRDAVNALLSLGYSLLSKDLTIACYAAGFDPMMGFYHQPRFGRPGASIEFNGAISAAGSGFGGGDGDQHEDGHAERFCERRGGGIVDGAGAEGVL